MVEAPGILGGFPEHTPIWSLTCALSGKIEGMSDASDVPAVRYLTAPAYTPDNPPPPFKTWWVRPNGLDLEILGRHVAPPDVLVPLGRHVVGSACAHEGTCSDHDRKLLAEHVVGREDTDD